MLALPGLRRLDARYVSKAALKEPQKQTADLRCARSDRGKRQQQAHRLARVTASARALHRNGGGEQTEDEG